MPLTIRSAFVEELTPSVRLGIGRAKLPPEVADDVFQQTFLKLLPHFDRLAAMPEHERRAYAYVTASREVMSLRRSHGRNPALQAIDDLHPGDARAMADSAPSPETLVRLAEGARRAGDAVDGLPTRDREILRAVESESPGGQVAERLGIPRRTMVYRLRLARDAVRRAWDGSTSFFGGANKKS